MPSSPENKKGTLQQEQKTSGGPWRRVLVVLMIFVAIGALGGGTVGLISPDGSLMQAGAIIPELQKIPYFGQYLDSLFIAAALLLLFVCLPQTVAAVLLLTKNSKQYFASIIAGAMLVVFTIVELIFFPSILSVIYLAIGIVEVIAAIRCHKPR